MTIPSSNRLDGVGAAGATTIVPIATIRAPAPSDIRGPNGQFKIGQLWVDSQHNLSYILSSFSTQSGQLFANWEAFGGGGGTVVSTLTGDTGGPISPIGGTIDIYGTVDQIVTTGTAGEIQIGFPPNVNITNNTQVFGNLTVSTGNLTVVGGEGLFSNGISLTGLNTRFLVGNTSGVTSCAGVTPPFTTPTISVANTNITANSIVICNMAGVSGFYCSVSSLTPGVGFDVTCQFATTASANYLIIN